MSAYRSGFFFARLLFRLFFFFFVLVFMSNNSSTVGPKSIRSVFTSAFMWPTGGSSAYFRFVCRNLVKCCLCRFALTSSGSVGSAKTDFIALLRDDLTDCSVGRFHDRSWFVWKCCSMGWYSSIFSSTSTMRLACSITVYHATDQWTDYSTQPRYERRQYGADKSAHL
jgi:hypothetical protein